MKKAIILLTILMALPSLALAVPQYQDAAVSVANNTEYREGTTDAANYYGFQINWTGSVQGNNLGSNVSFENNFNGSTWNATPTNNTAGIYWVNFTHITNISAANTLYTYTWYANNATGTENSTSSTTYFIQKNQTATVVINITTYAIGGTESNTTDSDVTTYEGQGEPYADCWMGSSPDGTGKTKWGTTNLYKDGVAWTKGSSGAVSLPAGSYTIKCNSTGTANVTDNSTGASFTLTSSAVGGSSSPDTTETVTPQLALPPVLPSSATQTVITGKNAIVDFFVMLGNKIVNFFRSLANMFNR